MAVAETETEKKTVETAQKVNQFWYETSQALVQSTFDVQDRSMQYVQNTFVDGIETLKSHIDAAQNLLRAEKKRQERQSQQGQQEQQKKQEHQEYQEQQESITSLVESGVEASKRNATFLQRTFEQGFETFRNNAGVMRELTQTVLTKAQEQRVIFW